MSDQLYEVQRTHQSQSQREQNEGSVFHAFQATRDPALRDHLVCEYLHLVQSVARRFLGLGETLDDLIQEGTIGLLNAVDLFNPSRGVKFSTYACPLIAGQIQHYLRDRGRLIRQPAWVQELNTKISRTMEQLSHELGREPLPEEVAAKLNLPEETVQNALSARELNHVMSLSAPSDANGETDLPFVDRETLSSSKLAAANLPIEDRIVLEDAVSTLKPLEQQVIHFFFFGDLNQSEIARKLGISVNYSSYLLRRSLAKIKDIIEEQRKKEAVAMNELRAEMPAFPSDIQTHDLLTGSYSDEYLRLRIAEEIARSQRYPTNFALMLVSVRGLEGLAEEQQPILAAIAHVIRTGTRTIDLVAYRHEDGCFALLLPHTGREARVLGERLCRHISLRQKLPPETPASLTLNIGFTVFPLEGTTVKALYERANQALTLSLHAGPSAVASVTNVWQPTVAP